jgi:hypothetical protein
MNFWNTDMKPATSRYYVWHPLTNKLDLLNRWYDSLMYKNLHPSHNSHSPFHRKTCTLLLVWCHCPPNWPPAFPLHVNYIWIKHQPQSTALPTELLVTEVMEECYRALFYMSLYKCLHNLLHVLIQITKKWITKQKFKKLDCSHDTDIRKSTTYKLICSTFQISCPYSATYVV